MRTEQVVANVAAMSRAVGYDPEKDTNWCHLPMEMRLRCIAPMDFITKNRLRRVSSTEKSLVSLTKHHFDRVSLRDEGEEISITARNMGRYGYTEELKYCWFYPREQKLQCALRILKTCDIDAFSLKHHKDEAGMFENPDMTALELAKCGPFRFKTFSSSYELFCAHEFFLENCVNLKRITYKWKHMGCETYFDHCLNHPSVVNATQLRITSCYFLNPIWDFVIQKWIDNDAPVGKSVQFVCFPCGPTDSKTLTLFATRFPDRIIEQNDKWIRARMNVDSRQLLVRKVRPDIDNYEYMVCKVIPTGLPKLKYVNGDSWIDQLWRSNKGHRGYYDEHSDTDAFCSADEM